MSTSGVAFPVAEFAKPAWKTWVGGAAALLIALLFLVAGLWKLTDPTGAAVRMAQAKVPEALSLAAAIGFGISETLAGVLILIPRYRRWGAMLAGALLVAFMLYIGFYYRELQGAECSCFPWVKRAVGPGFFIGDAIMLGLAGLAGVWAVRPKGFRAPAVILASVAVFAGVAYGVTAARVTGTPAPASITVDGQKASLQSGKIFVYFFDPACLHCLAAARKLATLNWGDTRVIGVAVTEPQFGPYFMNKSGLNKPLSTDWPLLKTTFNVKGTPGGVAIQNGREKSELTRFEGDEPETTLRKLGFVY